MAGRDKLCHDPRYEFEGALGEYIRQQARQRAEVDRSRADAGLALIREASSDSRMLGVGGASALCRLLLASFYASTSTRRECKHRAFVLARAVGESALQIPERVDNSWRERTPQLS